MDSVHIIGVRVDRVNFEEALNIAANYLRGDYPHLIVTADATTTVIAQHDRQLFEIVNSASLVTPDSAGIIWAAKRLGRPIAEKVSGVDLAWKLCEICAEEGHPVYLLGAAPGIADRAAKNLCKAYPRLEIAGVQHGFFENDDEVIQKIASSGAKLLLVAMGIPKQEKWIAQNMENLNIRLAMGVGGSFDVFAGEVKRAPKWMRDRGLEWMHRLISNPKKIFKVAKLPQFVWLVLKYGKHPAGIHKIGGHNS